MFYKIELKDHIRVPPDTFNLPIDEAIVKRVKVKYEGFISEMRRKDEGAWRLFVEVSVYLYCDIKNCMRQNMRLRASNFCSDLIDSGCVREGRLT